MRNPATTVLLAPIRFYQRWISPAWPSTCRFYPSCSSYAIEALQTRGAVVGLALAVRRLVKCAPWHPGGHDPVPRRVRSVSSPLPHQESSLVS
ncbi:MAG: membrane protein insertion efficiency factor YidD [Geodermatophilaceae bacterium]|nr:membrane protein insertion efficiency factor YidD [Geodermatophilaceae bacterium]